MGGMQIRKFNEMDIENLLLLFEEQFAETFGYIRKTPELWRYFVLNRPGVSKKGIFVCQQAREVIGYIVLGFKKMGGASVATIYEFCAKNERAAHMLLEKALEYSENSQVDYVLTQVPPSVQTVNRAIDKIGFIKMSRPETKIMVTLIDPRRIIIKLTEIFNKRQKTGRIVRFANKTKVIQFRIKRALVIGISDFSVTLRLTDGELTLVKYTMDKVDVKLEMKAYDFLRIFLGQASIFREFMTRRIRIRGFASNLYIFSLINALKIGKPFFFPLTDHF